MRSRTIILSLIVHAAIAATLLGAAGKKIGRRPTAVALAEEKKKAKPAPPKPPPPPPAPKVARPPAPKLAAIDKAPPAPVAKAAPAAPVATALTMSNDDGPGGIALPSRGGPAARPAAAAPVKVASAVTESRRQRLREAVGEGGAEAPCNEDPTKPEPVFKQEIEYTAAARAEGVEGRLKLRLVVGADGAVTKVDVVESVAPELDAAAVVAAKQWRFKPATACGKPVAGGTYVLVRRFELGD